MKNRNRIRINADCDMPHSYIHNGEMTLGPVPIDTDCDYGCNSSTRLQNQNNFENFHLYLDTRSYEARYMTMLFKI